MPSTPAAVASDLRRPVTRGDCREGARPCLWISCSHHLRRDVSPARRLPLAEMTETCALDVADKGGATLEEIGVMLSITRERVRQIERDALRTLHRRLETVNRAASPVGRCSMPSSAAPAAALRASSSTSRERERCSPSTRQRGGGGDATIEGRADRVCAEVGIRQSWIAEGGRLARDVYEKRTRHGGCCA